MKAITSVPGTPFYNSAPAPIGTWYGEPRSSTRQQRRAAPLALLDEAKGKQEIFCSVILTLSLVLAFFECLAGCAAS